MSENVTTRRSNRDDALDQAFLGRRWVIAAEIRLPADRPKFHAWISNARGHNGFKLVALDTGEVRVTGRTTVNDAIARNAIVNPEALTTMDMPAVA